MTETVFKGIFKLKEEMAELAVILNKLCICPDGKYFDDRDLNNEALEELADVKAALQYFIETNKIPEDHARYLDKLNKFRKWGLSGVHIDQPPTYDTLPKELWTL